jgi:DNA polymerase-3 subunit beta
MLVVADTAQLKQAIQRVMLLSNEKYKGVRLTLGENLLTLNARNPNQEEASEELEVVYTGDALEIGFNGQYLLEVLSTIPTAKTRLAFTDSNSSVLITPPDDQRLMQWVVMPMRL